MTRDEWRRVKGIVADALAHDAADLPAYLAAHCGADAVLRREVDSLLAAAVRAGDLYEEPTLLVAGARITLDALDCLAPPPAADVHFRGTDRYAVRREIGAGGMGRVYEVEDRQRRQIVALKTLQRWDAGDIYRLKHEFRSLADIAHPNLASLYELVVDDRVCFFTMELVDGVTFVDYVRGGDGTVDIDRLRGVLPQLVDGVMGLHQRGKLHRDVKPSNVLVAATGRVVLLDFGLTTNARSDASGTHVLAGTPAYLSPEQCLGQHATEASDWYGVGVTLYQALTGAVPFDGPLFDVVRQKTTTDPATAAAVAPGVPRDLDEICTALLCRDPDKRISGRDVRHRLSAAPSDAAALPAVRSAAAAFVGREGDLDVLEASFASVKQGRSVSIYLHGPSGIGKSALVQRFFDRCAASEAFVALRGRCHEHESVPYKGLDGVVDSVSRHLSGLTAAESARLMPGDAAALVRLFPVLQGLANAAPALAADGTDPVALRRRAFAALRDLLDRLARRQPLIIEIDDFQWADGDSAAFLSGLLRPPDPPPLLLIVSFRSEEIAAKPFLNALVEHLDVGTKIALPLQPLTDAEVTQLVGTLLPEDAGRADRAPIDIAREAGGNPFLVEELARYVALGAQTEVRGPTLEEMLTRRLDSLPRESRAFLETLAVCGRPIVPARIFEACGFTGDERPLVACLRSAHFLRGSRSPDQVELYHDRIRETLAADVSRDSARRIHALMAEILTAHGDDDPEALFEHHRGAGHEALAAAHAGIAAARASAVLAFDRAAAFYRHALELAPTGQPRAEWTIGLAKALENAGRPAEAGDAYLDAAREGDAAHRFERLRKAAEQQLIGGHIDRGLAIIGTILPVVGMRLNRGPRSAAAAIVGRRARLAWRGVDFDARDASHISPEHLLRIDTCWAISTGLLVVDTVQAASFHTRHLIDALDAGEPYRVARALAIEACLSAAGGGRAGVRRSAAFAARARGLAERIGHPHAIALSELTAGVAAFVLGDWARATDMCGRAMTMLRDECTGVPWELTLAQNFYLGSLFFRGELVQVSRILPGLLQAARERGNLYFETELTTRFNMVWLVADDPDGGEREANRANARWSDSGYHRQHYNHMYARVQASLYRARAEQAWALATDHAAAAQRHLWLHVYLMRVETAFLRGRCALAMAAAGHDARRMRTVAARDAGRLEREQTPWATAMARQMRATIAFQEGDRTAAAGELERAVGRFVDAGMLLYASVARWRLAALVGGDRGREHRRLAGEWLAAQEVRNPAAMAALLAPGLPD